MAAVTNNGGAVCVGDEEELMEAVERAVEHATLAGQAYLVLVQAALRAEKRMRDLAAEKDGDGERRVKVRRSRDLRARVNLIVRALSRALLEILHFVYACRLSNKPGHTAPPGTNRSCDAFFLVLARKRRPRHFLLQAPTKDL